MTTLNWKPNESRWNQGEQLYLGQFKIGSAFLANGNLSPVV
ncbi:hypothetical protein ACHCAL_15295 [Providencia huaxiensis]